ncbi:MAG: hypothetical protein WBB45_08410 [Cyclobacteriaceae bacterium]
MSSHHFVKEDQEPALLVMDFHPETDLDILEQLLEWSPRVLAFPAHAEMLLDAGYKVDVILSSKKDLETARVLQEQQRHITITELDSDRYGLYCLSILFVKALNILNAPLGELETAFLAEDTLHSYEVAFYWSQAKATLSGGMFKKWLPEGHRLELLTTVTETTHHNLSPVDQPPGGLFRSSQHFCVVKDGIVRISTGSKRLLVAEKA